MFVLEGSDQIISRNWDISQLPLWLPQEVGRGSSGGETLGSKRTSGFHAQIPSKECGCWDWSADTNLTGMKWILWAVQGSGTAQLTERPRGWKLCSGLLQCCWILCISYVVVFWTIIPGRLFPIQTEGKCSLSLAVCTWVTAKRALPVVHRVTPFESVSEALNSILELRIFEEWVLLPLSLAKMYPFG